MLFFLAADLIAAENEERCLRLACFSEKYSVGAPGEPLSLVSASRYKFWGFSVYSVALYQPDGLIKDWEEHPLAFVLHYHRTLKPEDFLKTSRKLMAKNPEYANRNDESSLLKFSSFIQEVKDGDRYTLLYSPEGTLKLIFQGQVLGEVRDKVFARAYLGMWLGKFPVKEDNRDCLLSGQFEG
ncbi:MAG: chalcone isomerase family protein [Bdellovibrionales bacterium]|nr:chalcone isomerase family protein [Bdellovibrionales bacterium]